MPATAWGWEITREELQSWILDERPEWLLINKPGCVVCHPSKHGPWSSLVGACREYLGAARLHMPFRLDRETSGVLLLVRDPELGARLQLAVQHRRAHKVYLAVLRGELSEPIEVQQRIGPDLGSRVYMKRTVTSDGAPSLTRFVPLVSRGGYTLARVEPQTGRLHQIRVHAAHIGYPVVGDKLYGGDESLFLEFVQEGFTERLSANLPLSRHALHCLEARFEPLAGFPQGLALTAPLPADLVEFCRRHALETTRR